MSYRVRRSTLAGKTEPRDASATRLNLRPELGSSCSPSYAGPAPAGVADGENANAAGNVVPVISQRTRRMLFYPTWAMIFIAASTFLSA